MEIIIIVAIDEKLAIGFKRDQLAYISGDLKRFKQLTTGHTIVMGRKTFEALPKGALPNRRNIVLTQNKELKLTGCEMATTAQEVLNLCKNETRLFVIGGGEIYKMFMPLANHLLITHIHHTFKNTDTWFPDINYDDWDMVEQKGPLTDEKNGLTYSYKNLRRKN
jgi:dihydrofolate reductase